MPMFRRHNFFDFIRWLTNIWLCRLRGVFSLKRPKYLGKSAYNITTHKNLLYNGIYFHFLKCISPPILSTTSSKRSFLAVIEGWQWWNGPELFKVPASAIVFLRKTGRRHLCQIWPTVALASMLDSTAWPIPCYQLACQCQVNSGETTSVSW